MQKKLEAELMSLAHDILKLKKGDNVRVLKDKAFQVYEKLAVLSFIDKYVDETPLNTKTKKELVAQTFDTEDKLNIIPELIANENLGVEKLEEKHDDEVAVAITNKLEEIEVEVEEPKKEVKQEIIEELAFEEPDNLFSKIEDLEPKKVVKNNIEAKAMDLQTSLEKEFGSTVSLDVTTDLFENAERISPKKSINDAIMQQKNLQIDLNDRIAFVKNLFENSQEDFNRVISQLNTMATEKEAMSLIRMIKKEYNWDGKEVYEERLLMLIERKFN